MPIDMPPPIAAYDNHHPMTVIADNSAKYGWPRKYRTSDKNAIRSRVRLIEIPSDSKGTVRCRFARSPSLPLWYGPKPRATWDDGPRVQCTVVFRLDSGTVVRGLVSIGTIWEDGSYTYFTTTARGVSTYNPPLT